MMSEPTAYERVTDRHYISLLTALLSHFKYAKLC